MAQLHLVVGPVGAGKSTFVRQLCRERKALSLNLDEWMANLFRADRPDSRSDGQIVQWYVERSQRCIEQIWRVALSAVAAGTEVVLEIGLIQRHDREAFYRRVEAHAFELSICVLDAPRELRRHRVQRRNHDQGDTFAMVVPPHIFELASDMWEPPTPEECLGRQVTFVATP